MVTTNNPYTRTTWVENYAWNEIIQEVNELAENPDEGCDSLETLEEVEEDYIWNKKDVVEVQDKLMEICPDNEFTELLDNQPWTSVIIDEIITAIEIGWCECVPADLASRDWQLVEMGHNDVYCGGYVSASWFSYLPGVTIEWRRHYISPCPGIDTSQDAREILQVSCDTAKENIEEWIENRREELLEQRKVEEFSVELKAKKTQLESLQNQLATCQSGGGDCSSIILQISEIEEKISELEGKIQEAKNKRDAAKEKADENLILANEAAIINWEIAQEIVPTPVWISVWINLITTIIDAGVAPREKDEDTGEEGWGEWGLGSHPYTSPKKSRGIITGAYIDIGKLAEYAAELDELQVQLEALKNQLAACHEDCENIEIQITQTEADILELENKIREATAGIINYKTFIYCTPDGLPFTRGPVGHIYGYRYFRFFTESRSMTAIRPWSAWEAGDTMISYKGQVFAESIWERPVLGPNIYKYTRKLGTGRVEEYDPDPDQ